MSVRRVLQVSLAGAVACASVAAMLAFSAQGAQRPPAIHVATIAKAASRTRVALKVRRRSHLARPSRCDAPSGSLAYGYPVKPFHRPHPIRGYFGDPRTPGGRHSVFAPGGPGPFNFHNGVDIVAADGAPVYPVLSGVAIVNPDNVVVDSHGRWFQYYHLVPAVRSGQHVDAYQTVLGHIQAPHRHVHLTEGDGRSVTNPLEPGHLEPYDDRTTPAVDGVHFTGDRGRLVYRLRLKGEVRIAADAHDMPVLPIKGDWPGLGVTPATVSWRLETPGGAVAVPWTTVADFRQTEPGNDDFWRIFAPGTHQNKYGPKGRITEVKMIGLYSYDLTPAGLDTRKLPNGVYTLTVRASDTCGNSGSLTEQIRVANPAGKKRSA